MIRVLDLFSGIGMCETRDFLDDGARNGGDRRSDGGWETMIGRAIRALIEGGKEEK